jgi:nucleotide-binding universal stress UspA family protein
VLLCNDGKGIDDPAVPVAAEWASALGLPVQVLYVAHPLDTSPDRPPATLDRVVAKLRGEGVDTSAICRVSAYVPGAIADDVGETPATIVVMASHARTGVARVALGSVAMGTVALSQCPVVVTRGKDGPEGPA